jgi:hypothetical protein
MLGVDTSGVDMLGVDMLAGMLLWVFRSNTSSSEETLTAQLFSLQMVADTMGRSPPGLSKGILISQYPGHDFTTCTVYPTKYRIP